MNKKKDIDSNSKKIKNKDFNVEKKEKFPITSKINVSILFRIKGTLARKDITISIAPIEVMIILVLNLLTI